MAGEFRSLDEFWPFYVSQHLHPTTRLLHFAGTTIGLTCLAASLIWNNPYWIPLGLVLNHYRADQNKTYLVTEVQHFASAGQAYTTAGTIGGETYSNQFSCILSCAEFPYHPPRVTPKPFVQGPQPALVVGKSGEEIWVDKYGRVIVQFYWDRMGKKNEVARAGSAPLSPGPGKIWERCRFRASDRRSW